LLKREELMAAQSVLAFAVQVRQHFFAGRES
jgi:hypothetical protein